MKSEIIRELREAEGYISGQELCDRFHVSRTAIWKVINQLKEEGYQIEAVRNKGYHMVENTQLDVMNKQAIESHMETKILGQMVVCFPEIDSTNSRAKILAEQEQAKGHGTLVVADMQCAGKGRRGRNWESPAGAGIFMSLLLRPEFPPIKAPMLTLVMAQAVTKVLREEEGLEAFIKWPNDIIVNGRKVCGILTEMSTEIDYINYVVIGVGINANMEEFPEELTQMATSLKLEKGEPIVRARLIAAIMKEFEVLYERFCNQLDLAFMKEDYNKLLINREEYVKVLEPRHAYEAYALGIDENGELLVRTEDGEIIKVYAGEVSVRGLYGYV
ncbi:MAG: biotin--[acetyl-CoA-carboxylase] ligase [Eubacteriales bacterium]